MLTSKRRTKQGFALPAVLAVIGVVTLIFLVAMTALSSLTSEAASARARVRFLQNAMTAEAQIAYLAATEPMKPFGLSINDNRRTIDLSASFLEPEQLGLSVEQVRLDGRPYHLQLDQPLRVELRDEAGLLNLTNLMPATHQRLLQALGVEAGLQPELIARYYDYIDTDDLRQAQGAERPEYGLLKPANRRLIKAQEYLSILGMREAIDARTWRRLAPQFTANGLSSAINVNTASPAVLAIQLGLSDAQIEAVIQRRQEAPIQTLFELEAITGEPFTRNFETNLTFPSGSFVFKLHDTQSAWTYSGRIILNPIALEQPLWIDQFELTEAPRRAAANISDAPRLPTPPR